MTTNVAMWNAASLQTGYTQTHRHKVTRSISGANRFRDKFPCPRANNYTYRAQGVQAQIQPCESGEVGERIDPKPAYVVPAEIQYLQLGQAWQVYPFYFLREERTEC